MLAVCGWQLAGKLIGMSNGAPLLSSAGGALLLTSTPEHTLLLVLPLLVLPLQVGLCAVQSTTAYA
jgi:hypothetical protein